jgi:hypothetical protein
VQLPRWRASSALTTPRRIGAIALIFLFVLWVKFF